MDAFRPADRIVELGCGAGRNAITLAHRGIHFFATDVSPKDCSTRARAVREGVVDFVTTRICSAAGAGSMFSRLSTSPSFAGRTRSLDCSARRVSRFFVARALGGRQRESPVSHDCRIMEPCEGSSISWQTGNSWASIHRREDSDGRAVSIRNGGRGRANQLRSNRFCHLRFGSSKGDASA